MSVANYTRTGKPLSNRLVANDAAVSVVQVTFSQSPIECEQVQVQTKGRCSR